MRKKSFLAIAAAMIGLSEQAQEASNESIKFTMAHEQPIQFFPDNELSPKYFGMYVATSKTFKAKSKRKHRVAFG